MGQSATLSDWFMKPFHCAYGCLPQVEGSEKPTLLFIHGAGHGAWCWQVNTDTEYRRAQAAN